VSVWLHQHPRPNTAPGSLHKPSHTPDREWWAARPHWPRSLTLRFPPQWITHQMALTAGLVGVSRHLFEGVWRRRRVVVVAAAAAGIELHTLRQCVHLFHRRDGVWATVCRERCWRCRCGVSRTVPTYTCRASCWRAPVCAVPSSARRLLSTRGLAAATVAPGASAGTLLQAVPLWGRTSICWRTDGLWCRLGQ
jgi:hypothetical protein